MKYDITLERIANCYYNLGLERARLRDLSGAADLLKKALLFNKYHRDARNLLGLIFFECGETADALVQWVISMNLNPENNPADHYLEQIQRRPAILNICSDNVKRYNQALDYAQNNNEDLAVMQLNQVIEDSPNYIKAHILLALLYMKRSDWIKAGRSLFKVLKIDRNNPKALVLMDEVKHNTGRKEAEQKRLQNLFSHRKMIDDDVVVPQEVKEISPWTVVGYILAGMFLALLSFYLLIMPARVRALNAENNKELINYTSKLDLSNSTYYELNDRYQALQQQFKQVSDALEAYQNQNASFMGQYQTMNQIDLALSGEDYDTAAKLYLGLDRDSITDTGMLERFQDIKGIMEGRVYQQLADQGTTLWNSSRKDEAAQKYLLSIQLRQEPENMYLLARLYQSMGRQEEANQLFDRIVGEHPASKYAEKARNARGY